MKKNDNLVKIFKDILYRYNNGFLFRSYRGKC